MTYPYGIGELLDHDQRTRLENSSVSLGHGRTRTAASMIVGWAGRVTRLSTEHTLAPGEDHHAWNAHDYVAALVIRGFVQRALDGLGPDLRPAATRAVARFDDLLRSFTEPDDRHVLGRFAAQDVGEQWWWQRIPISGPVRTELDRYSAYINSIQGRPSGASAPPRADAGPRTRPEQHGLDPNQAL